MCEICDLHDAGDRAWEEERWSDAAELFQAALARAPGSPRALSGLACAFSELRRYDEAIATYQRLLAITEQHFYLTLLGAIQNHVGQREAAIATLGRSLELEPADDEAHYHLALALQPSDPAAALDHLQAACRIDPLPATYHREIAFTLWLLQRFDDALEASDRALAANPADDRVHHGRGLIQESLGDLQSAKESHLRAADIMPTCGLWWSSAACLAARQRRDREADRLFRRGVASDEESAVVRLEYGQFLQRRGRLATARPYLARAVELAPDNPRMRQALAEFDAVDG
jgi:tetratricopeptide (TPR) repeat protein